MIEKKDGLIDTSLTIDEAYHRWQAYTPWPGFYTEYSGAKVTLLEIEKKEGTGDIGTWKIEDKNPVLQFSDGGLIIKKIHPAGKKPMTGEEFVRGFMRD